MFIHKWNTRTRRLHSFHLLLIQSIREICEKAYFFHLIQNEWNVVEQLFFIIKNILLFVFTFFSSYSHTQSHLLAQGDTKLCGEANGCYAREHLL